MGSMSIVDEIEDVLMHVECRDLCFPPSPLIDTHYLPAIFDNLEYRKILNKFEIEKGAYENLI